MKSCSSPNEVKININLPNLFNFILCLPHNNDHINNLKDYGDFAEENKQFDSCDSQHDGTQPNDVTSWSQLQKIKNSFYQMILLRY